MCFKDQVSQRAVLPTSMQFKLSNAVSFVIMEIHGDSFHPGIVSVARVINIASVYLDFTIQIQKSLLILRRKLLFICHVTVTSIQ